MATEQSTDSLANLLVDLGIIKVAKDQPFFYTSGWASPIYLDTQVLLSNVSARKHVMEMTAAKLGPLLEQAKIQAIVGTESSGVAYAAWMAQEFSLPLLFLRKKPVGWGMTAQIEGLFSPGDRVLLVDDVTTDGKSKIDACLALRKSGLEMHHAFLLIHFGIYPYTKSLLNQHRLELHALIDWPTLFQAYRSKNTLAQNKLASIEAFSRDPVAWSVQHGGIGQWTS